jgi:hypothetical protein
MTRPKTAVNTTNPHGEPNDVTKHRTQPIPRKPSEPSTRVSPTRADAALHPVTPDEVMLSRAKGELDWWFSYAEGAIHREDVSILPSYAAVRLPAGVSDGDCRARAFALGRTVQGCLASLRAPHASVLRAAFTPRRWPRAVRSEFRSLAGIAVRLVLSEDPWPPRTMRAGLEDAAAGRLSAAIAGTTKLPVGRIKARAHKMLGGAVVAYFKARSPEGLALV